MLQNHIKSSWRNLKKRWPFTFTNILGLSIGIASFLFLMGYTQYEKSFDSFHKDNDRLFRVVFERYAGSELKTKSKYNVPGITHRIKEEIDGIENTSRFVSSFGVSIVKNEEITFEETKLYYADSDFLKMFSFKALHVNISSLLEQPNSVVLTEFYAKKLFGDKNPIGQEIKVANAYGKKKFTITGVLKDLPKNSSFDFNILCSIHQAGWGKATKFLTNWKSWMFPTYIKLKDGVDIKTIQNQFPAFIKKYRTDPVEKDITWKYSFQNIKDIHLKSGYEENSSNPDKKNKAINLLSIIAILVISISWINYINLSTSSLGERAKEIGIRKSIGASKFQIIFQFLLEVVLLNLIAILLAFIAILLFTKPLSILFQLDYNYEMFSKPIIWFYSLFILIIGTCLSGIYPALLLSNFKPSVVLKSKNTTTTTNPRLRKILIGFQFSISLLLICCTLIIVNQNNYMKNIDLGININDVLVLKKPQLVKQSIYKKKLEAFKNELERIPSVLKTSSSSSVPSISNFFLSAVPVLGGNKDRHVTFAVDQDYVSLYDLKIIEGRNFNKKIKQDKNAVLISELSVNKLGFKNNIDAIDKEITIEDKKTHFKIIGVFDNYHHMSLQNQQLPYILTNNKYSSPKYISLKANSLHDLNEIERVYKTFFSKDLFEFFILKDKFDLQYVSEDRYQNIFLIFSIITILLASMGVIGMSSYFALLKSKEIAIRKVFGAEKHTILWVLSKEFLFVLGMGVIISIPIIFYVMTNWLNNFPYKINISFVHIFTGIATISSIIFLVIRINLRKSLNSNPIKSL